MNNPGITAQYGFAFQKLVFVLQCLERMSSIGDRALYEADDDVVIEKDLSVLDNSLSKIRTNELFIQCKTGEINKQCFSNVIKNWLSFMSDNHRNFILFSELPCSFAILDFKDEIAREIKETIKNEPRANSILFKLYEKYICGKTFNSSLFEVDFKRIIDNSTIEVKDQNYIEQRSIELLKTKHLYGEDPSDVTESVYEARYEELIRNFFSEIDRQILLKKRYEIDFNALVGKLTHLITKINNNKFDINFTTFKKGNRDAVDNMFAKNAREVNFLKKIYFQDFDAINAYLCEELFYSRYRQYYFDLNKSNRIDSIEDGAYSEYVKKRSLYSDLRDLFDNVCNNFDIKQYDDFSNELKGGCFVYLSGDNAPEEYFIDWNGENAK